MDRCEVEVPCISDVVGEGEDAHRVARVGELSFPIYVGQEQERIPAGDLAKPLGYARPRDFAKLVRRLETERPEFGRILVRATVARGRNQHGETSRTVETKELMLNERQALLAAISSDTDAGWRVRAMLVDVFLALRHMASGDGLPMPEVRQLVTRVDRVESENADLRAKLALFDPLGSGVIGAPRAEVHLLGPLRAAARLACVTAGDNTRAAYQREFKERENELRTHVSFPSARGYRWEHLPLADFGKAQVKAIQILEREKHRSKRVVAEVSRRLKQLEISL